MSAGTFAASGLQALLGLVGVVVGGVKVAGREDQVEEFQRFGYPQWFRTVTGTIEVTAGLALVAGFLWLPELALAGGVLLGGVMAGAVVTHLRVGDPVVTWAAPAVLFVLAIALLALQYPTAL